MTEDRIRPLGGAQSAMGSVDSLLSCLRQELYEVEVALFDGRDLETMERADFMGLGIVRALDYHLERCQARQEVAKRKKESDAASP